MEENTEKKEKTPEQIKKEETQVFWVRFVFWTIFALILPVGFIVWRFELFKAISAVQFGGWGVLAVIIIAVFCIVCLKYVNKGMIRYSMTKQVVVGICKVTIPLLALYWIITSISSNVQVFLQALAVVIGSETIAIPINPFPKWVDERTQGAMDSSIDYFFKRYDERKEKNGGK